MVNRNNISETVLLPLMKTGVAGEEIMVTSASELSGWTWWPSSYSRLLVHCFDDAHSKHLSHVTNSRMIQKRIVKEVLNRHGLARNYINNLSITRFQEFGAIFQLLPRMMINQSFASAQQTCKQHELCDSPAQVHSCHWLGLDGSG